MFFSKRYMSKNEEKALAAVAGINDQEKLLEALKEIENKTVRTAAIKRLDNDHLRKYVRSIKGEENVKEVFSMLDEDRLISYIKEENKNTTICVYAISQLKDQDELVRIILDDCYDIYGKEAAIDNLDAGHSDREMLRKIAMTAKPACAGLSAVHGLAAVKKLDDQETLSEIANGAENGTVSLEAAKKLKDRENILSFLLLTKSSFNFRTILSGIELTSEEKTRLSNEAELRDNDVMEQMFTKEELYEQCIQKRDPGMAKTLSKTIWDKEKLEALKGILGSVPESDFIEMRLNTIRHMENLKSKGLPAEINEKTIEYNSTLLSEMSLLQTVKRTVWQNGLWIDFDDIYEKSGDELNQIVANRTRLYLTFLLGGPLLGGIILMGPSHWLSENAKDAVWMVIASFQKSHEPEIMERVSPDINEKEAAALIKAILHLWWLTEA